MLLQALVMSVLLSMIAVMVLKWVMARYIMVSRIQESSINTSNAYAYVRPLQTFVGPDKNTWTIDSSGSTFLDGENRWVGYGIKVQAPREVVITVPYDSEQ